MKLSRASVFPGYFAWVVKSGIYYRAYVIDAHSGIILSDQVDYTTPEFAMQAVRQELQARAQQ